MMPLARHPPTHAHTHTHTYIHTHTQLDARAKELAQKEAALDEKARELDNKEADLSRMSMQFGSPQGHASPTSSEGVYVSAAHPVLTSHPPPLPAFLPSSHTPTPADTGNPRCT